MKRAGNLFEKICSWENLELAAKKARKRKRLRIYSENFELKRETILSGIRAKLLDGPMALPEKRPPKSITFRKRELFQM